MVKDAGERGTMDKSKTKVRFWIVGPFLFYLFVFLLWFPRWQHAPHSLSARLLGLLFGAMTLLLVVLGTIGNFFVPMWRGGWAPVGELAIRLIERILPSAVADSDRRGVARALFHTDSVCLSYSNVEMAKQWWIDAFGCKQAKVPPDWDNPLPSDVALRLPEDSQPTILLSDKAELAQAGFDRPSPTVPVIFSEKLKKAHDVLSSRGIAASLIQGDGESKFFEVRDLEGHVIEICKEP